jgi:hypothetical protein
MVIKPIISNTTFKTIVIAETENGIKLVSTMAKPEILLTAAWLGIRKKNTAAPMIMLATVRIKSSLITDLTFIINL